MYTKLLLATLAGAVISFFLGWLVYGILLMDFFAANMTAYEGLMKEMPNLLFMIIGSLAMWFMISFIFQRWAGFKTFVEGLYGGGFIGFFIAVGIDLSLYSMYNLFSYSYIIMDIVVSTVMTAIVSGVVALILGSGKKEAV